MDKLARRLREDADRIDARISPELDARIRASLQGIEPVPGEDARPRSRPRSFWWASTLTGVAAALGVIAIVNLNTPEPGPAVTEPAPAPLVLPTIKWSAETAVLTTPLEQEIENLRSDLEKAEDAVKQDIDRLF